MIMEEEIARRKLKGPMRQKEILKKKQTYDADSTGLPSKYGKRQTGECFRRGKDKLKHEKESKLLVGRRTFLLPALPNTNALNLADGFAVQPKANHRMRKIFPKYLPKIEATNGTKLNGRKRGSFADVHARRLSKFDSKKMSMNNRLPTLITRAAPLRPARDAISTPATLRGLIRLTSDEKFILRFRLSNYVARDVKKAHLNRTV